MSPALYGFTGDADPAIEKAMAGALAHRGAASKLGVEVEVAGRLVAPPAFSSEANVEEYLAALRGSFVLRLNHDGQVYLARDLAGRQSLYYALHEGRLVYASEPKAILALPGFERRMRPAAVAQFLTFSFIPGKGTMLEGVYALPPGTYVRFDPKSGELSEPMCFRFPEQLEGQQELSDSEWAERFNETLSEIITDLCRPSPQADRAVFLSGGIDSSLVTAALAEHQAPRSIHAYSIHFGHRYPNELEYARAVAEKAGVRHDEVEVSPKSFIPRLREFVRALDEPIGDPVALPNFELARIVGKDFREVFNGEGGDPLFGGPKNMPMMLHHWYGGTLTQGRGHRERAYLGSYRRCYEELPHLLTPEFRREVDQGRDLEGILTPFFEASSPSLLMNKLTLINMRLKGAHLILPKVERTLGAHGVTPLSPLFDERMIDLSFALPTRLKLQRGVEKVILKRAFAGRLPQEVIDRPKAGMRVPVYFWMQREMHRLARKVLSPKRIKADGIFRPERVKQLLDYKTEEGPGRYGMRLWMLLTFHIWMEEVFG